MTSRTEQRILDGSAWRDFCRALEKAGDTILRPSTPASVFDRAEGIRYLTRLLRAGLESQIESSDPRHPRFFQLSNETIRIGNDNPDNIYHNCNISGRYDYRIKGTRGSVPYLSFGTKAGSYDRDAEMRPTGQIDARRIEVDADGRFEILVSRTPKLGNWLPMEEASESIIVRQTFDVRGGDVRGGDVREGDVREGAIPAYYEIECLNPEPGEHTDALDPGTLEAALGRTTAFVTRTADLFIDWMEIYEKHLNQLPSDDQDRCQRAGGDANIHYHQSYWVLGPDEALVIEVDRIPKRGTWNFQLSNYWMESLEYRHHRIHVNHATAAYEPDGSLCIVVAHRDPGRRFPNWLDTCRHDRGGMLFRWIGCGDDHPPVNTRVVRFSELAAKSS